MKLEDIFMLWKTGVLTKQSQKRYVFFHAQDFFLTIHKMSVLKAFVM